VLENLYQILNAYNASWKIEKMKAIVAHHYWDRAGGGELVDSAVVKVLQGMGLEVYIVSTTGFRKDKYKEWAKLLYTVAEKSGNSYLKPCEMMESGKFLEFQ